MRDRIPTPGKENRVKITKDSGEAIEGVLSYADNAAQQGSIYCKANVLPDDVCDRLGLDRVTAEPKDAFNVTAGNKDNIAELKDLFSAGRVITTMRTDLDDTWLPCDGSMITEAEYPELAPLLPATYGTYTSYTTGQTGVSNIIYGGGYYVICGNGGIRYAADPAGEWKVSNIGWTQPEQVAYGDGYWVAVGSGNQVKCTTDLDGEWINCTNAPTNTTRIAYGDGYWAINGISSSYGQIHYTNNLFGSWTTTNVGTTYPNISISGIAYGDGYWAVSGREAYSDGGGVSRYATDLDGTWRNVPSSGQKMRSCSFVHDRFFWFREDGSVTCCFHPVNIPSPISLHSSEVGLNNYCAGYTNGIWFLGGSGQSRWSTDFESWQTIGVGAAAAVSENGRIITASGNTVRIHTPVFTLPTISSGANSYIRAKTRQGGN